MRRITLALARLALLGAVAGCLEAPADAGGFVTAAVHLEVPTDPLGCPPPTRCADFCVDTAGADIYREGDPIAVPIGPGKVAQCGQELVFEGLPAGHNVWLKAWLSQGLTRRFEGDSQSAPTTIQANAIKAAAVALAPLSLPEITTVSPNPALPGDTVTIQGIGFGEGIGLSQVELGCAPLATASWSDTELHFQAPAAANSDLLRVRRCGLYPQQGARLRLVTEAPKAVRLTPPGCAGFSVRATAPAPWGQGILLVAACDANAGQVLSFQPQSCGYGDATSLPDAPLAAATFQEATTIALHDGTLRQLDAQGQITPVNWSGAAPLALVSGPAGIQVVTKTAVLGLADGGERAPLAADLDLRGAAGSDAGLLLAARDTGGGQGKLVRIPDTGGPIEYVLPGCDQPRALAARRGARFAVVACDDGFATFDVHAGLTDWVPAPGLQPSAVALDAVGDAAFSFGARWEGIAPGQGRRLGGYPLPEVSGRVLISAGPDAMLLGGDGAAFIIVPYAGGTACPKEVAP